MLMPGDRQISLSNPVVVQLFRVALGHQAIWILPIAVLVAITAFLAIGLKAPVEIREPRPRTLLRWSFGLLWVIDGILQFQPSMPLGLGSQVAAPAAVGAPWWLHSVVLDGVGIWNRHPIALAAAVAWLEIGVGLVMIATRGRALRIAAAVSLSLIHI